MIYEMIHFTIEMFNISTYIQENNLDFSLTQFICKMKNRQTFLKYTTNINIILILNNFFFVHKNIEKLKYQVLI